MFVIYLVTIKCSGVINLSYVLCTCERCFVGLLILIFLTCVPHSSIFKSRVTEKIPYEFLILNFIEGIANHVASWSIFLRYLREGQKEEHTRTRSKKFKLPPSSKEFSASDALHMPFQKFSHLIDCFYLEQMETYIDVLFFAIKILPFQHLFSVTAQSLNILMSPFS